MKPLLRITSLGNLEMGTGIHRAGACAGVRCVRALVAGVVLLVLKSAFDDPGLVATAVVLTPLDVLVIGCQDGL